MLPLAARVREPEIDEATSFSLIMFMTFSISDIIVFPAF